MQVRHRDWRLVGPRPRRSSGSSWSHSEHGGGELRLPDSTAGLLATWHHHVVVRIVKMLNPLGRVVNCGCREPLNPPLPSSPLDTPPLSRFH